MWIVVLKMTCRQAIYVGGSQEGGTNYMPNIYWHTEACELLYPQELTTSECIEPAEQEEGLYDEVTSSISSVPQTRVFAQTWHSG